MRSRIVEEVVRRGPAELATRARALIPRIGNLALQLLELGYPPSAIIDGASAATGVKPASPAWLREPSPPPVDYDDGLLFRVASAAPVATEAGTLCVAYGDPEAAADSTNHGLPPHRAYLAMPAQLSRALALLPEEPTLAEGHGTVTTRRAAWAARSEAQKASVPSREQRRVDAALDGALDDAIDVDGDVDSEAAAEATRTVPGSAPPPFLAPPAPAEPGGGETMTAAASLEELRRVAEMSRTGPRAGPASREGDGFEDVLTQQAELVPAAARAAVEPTVTRTESGGHSPPLEPPKQRLVLAEDDYDDAATVALNQRELKAMVAAPLTSKNLIAASKPPVGDDDAFNDPTEHVGVLTSRELMAVAKTAHKAAEPALATEPTPAPRAPPAPAAPPARASANAPPRVATPAPSARAAPPASRGLTPPPRTPAPRVATPRTDTPPPRTATPPPRVPAPSTQVDAPSRLALRNAAVELAETQPMPRHSPTTEGEVIPVPVARRGPSPLASVMSAFGSPTPDDHPANEPGLDPPMVRSSERGARLIPGFDDAEPAPAATPARRHIPGFDAPEPSGSAPRKGRTVMLHPVDEPARERAMSAAQQETEAVPPAELDPSALQPVDEEPAPRFGAHEAPNAAASALDFLADREVDFSRPPLPQPSVPTRPPPASALPRFDSRASMRRPFPEEPDPRAVHRRGGGGGAGLQVLRPGGAPVPPPGLELASEAPPQRPPPPLIPGIDTPLPPEALSGLTSSAVDDGRSRQILVAAGLIAVLIIAAAALVRVRQSGGLGAGGAPSAHSATNAPAVLEVPAPESAPALAPSARPAPVDPRVEQAELIDEARRLADPVQAIRLYTRAIELAPVSLPAKDALFERAKLYLATGDAEGARADVATLRARSDARGLERDLKLILDGAAGQQRSP